MSILLFAAAITTNCYVACTNCAGHGFRDIVCPSCSGKGLVANPRFSYTRKGIKSDHFIPCSKCSKGLVRKDSRGTGKIPIVCPVCKGRRKFKVTP